MTAVSLRRIAWYGTIGGVTAALYLLVALSLTHGLGAPPALSSAIGFAAASPLSYLGHRVLTFRSQGEHRDELPRFVTATVLGFLLSTSVPELAVGVWDWTPTVGFLTACIVVPVFNYLLFSAWVFVGNRKATRAAQSSGPGRDEAALGTQKYAPYRSRLLTAPQLRALNQLQPARVTRDTLWLWVQIAAAWTAVALRPEWWAVLIAIPVIGTRYYALYIIGHDGLHRRLFATTAANDLWNDLFILGPIGGITRLNRINHIRHHATLALPNDPDRYKYSAADRPTKLAYALALTGLPYLLRSASNVFGRRRRAPNTAADTGYTTRDLAILVLWQAVLVVGLSWFIGWWAYPVLWLLPVYLFTYAADMVRVFLEHSLPMNDDDADRTLRLITYRSNAVERRFFAPMNMNFHTAHHLWPSIPYYGLPEADRLIRQSPRCDSGLIWRGSYLAYLLDYARRLPWNTASVGVRTGPETLGA